MDSDTWKTVAAVWGAGLSTFLALSKMLPEYPVIFIDRIEGKTSEFAVKLWVMNPSKRPLFLNKLSKFSLPRGNTDIVFMPNYRGNYGDSWSDFAITGKFSVCVPPEDKTSFYVRCAGKNTNCILILNWHRNWLFFPALPAWVRLSSAIAKEVNSGR